MDSDQFELMMKESIGDVEFIARLRRENGDEEYNRIVFSTFKKYINDDDVIAKIARIGTHTWELSVILELEKEEWFSETLEFLTRELRSTFNANKEKTVQIAELLYPSIHESLACWHDSFFLSKNIDARNPRHAVRAYFRMLGDMIESTHKPHIEFVYKILRINPCSQMYKKPKDVSLGQAVSSLIEIKELERIYKTNLLGVSISQWRNIAHHSNYRIEKDKNSITCTYGGNVRYEVRITVDGLLDLLKTFNKLQALQKIAVGFFLVEFMNEIQFDKHGDIDVTIETIISEIGNGLGLEGFKVVSVSKNSAEYVFKIDDSGDLGLNVFKRTISRLSPFIAFLEEKGHRTVFDFYDAKGTKLTEARIARNKSSG